MAKVPYHFISLGQFSSKEIKSLLALTGQVKRNPGHFRKKLAGRTIGLLFQKPSLRTKASFFVGAGQVGAFPLYFSPDEVNLGKRESIADVARTVSGYFDAVVLRTNSHRTIEEFSKYSSVPVINALSDYLHPSQVIGDLFTLQELNYNLRRTKVVYIGDGNNVCNSLLLAFSILGGDLTVVTPREFVPCHSIVAQVKQYAKKSNARISFSYDPHYAVKGANVVYTDVWVSMGKEKEASLRKRAFRQFTVNEALIKGAEKGCRIMHCLPAHRGEEITDALIESTHSVVFRQAHNRLHSAKAILLTVLGKPNNVR